jgi:hypothetical protein
MFEHMWCAYIARRDGARSKEAAPQVDDGAALHVCIHARHPANNITERANLAFEKRLNKDAVCVDLRPTSVRPPLTAG